MSGLNGKKKKPSILSFLCSYILLDYSVLTLSTNHSQLSGLSIFLINLCIWIIIEIHRNMVSTVDSSVSCMWDKVNKPDGSYVEQSLFLDHISGTMSHRHIIIFSPNSLAHAKRPYGLFDASPNIILYRIFMKISWKHFQTLFQDAKLLRCQTESEALSLQHLSWLT